MALSASSEVQAGGVVAATRRAWPRRVLGLLIVALVAGGAITAYVLRSAKTPGPPKQPVASSSDQSQSGLRRYTSPLGWSIRFPRGMHVEHAAASGISFGVNEATFASFRSRHGVQRRVTPNSETIRELPPRSGVGSFPAHGIAVRVLWLETLAGIPSAESRLPLRLSSFKVGGLLRQWYPGTHPRPLQHVLQSKGQRYFIQVWIGPKASAQQRALLARMIASISVRRPRSRS
jgi:hypothetical protein